MCFQHGNARLRCLLRQTSGSGKPCETAADNQPIRSLSAFKAAIASRFGNKAFQPLGESVQGKVAICFKLIKISSYAKKHKIPH